MDVAQDSQEIGVIVYESAAIAALEQMPGGAEEPVTISSETDRDTLDDPSQRLLAGLNQRVQVISHPAKGMKSNRIALNRARRDFVELEVIGVAREQWLAVVAAQSDVITRPRDVYAWPSGHSPG